MANLKKALQWSFAGEIASKTIQSLGFVMLARILNPNDFGTITAANMVFSFSQILWDAGLSKALVHRRSLITEGANFAFAVNCGLGLLIALILFVSSNLIAERLFKDSRVTDVLRFMTLHILLGSLSSVQIALLQKEMRFKELFWVRFATISLPIILSIVLAHIGYGYWSMILSMLVGQFVQACILWSRCNWRPTWVVNHKVAKEMLGFGVWVGITGLLGWFYFWLDSIFVGHYLGNHELGLYNVGGRFSLLIYTTVFSPVLPVLYSQLSRVSADSGEWERIAEKSLGLTVLISVPLAIMLYGFSTQIETVFFSKDWQGMGYVLGLMSLGYGYSFIVAMNGEFYRAFGKPSYETIVSGAGILIYLAIYLWAIGYGLDFFVRARTILAISSVVFHLMVLKKVVNIKILALLFKVGCLTALSGIVVFATIKILRNLSLGAPQQLALGLFSSAFLIYSSIKMVAKKLPQESISIKVL